VSRNGIKIKFVITGIFYRTFRRARRGSEGRGGDDNIDEWQRIMNLLLL
jgi:hypothetical protein